jgi:transcriptional regulator with XRE-family HTH domain
MTEHSTQSAAPADAAPDGMALGGPASGGPASEGPDPEGPDPEGPDPEGAASNGPVAPDALLGDDVVRDEVERLGRLIRSARGEQYSLEALAAKSGVSAGLLSQIERGIGNPSFQTLLRVAHALDIPVAKLLTGGAERKPESEFVVRTHERRHITWPKEGMSWDILNVPGQREFTAMLGKIPPQFRETAFYNPRHYRGMVWSHVLRGEVTVMIGDLQFTAGPGDSYSGMHEQIRWVHNHTDEEAVVLSLLIPGAF